VAISYVIALHWLPHFLGRFGWVAESINLYTSLWSGVDLFFCISGYVIAKSTIAASTDHLSIRSLALPFWIRRIFRLWPSAWLWAVIPVILSIAWNASGIYGKPSRAAADAAMAILNVANFHYYHCLRSQTCGSLSVYWSLSLEEQFYWVFPLLIVFLRRRVLIVVLAILATVQIVLPRPNSFLSADPSLLWLIRTDAISLGILVALFERPASESARPFFLRTPLRASLVTITLLSILATATAIGFPQATGALALASAGLVWIAQFDRGLILPKTRLDPAVLWVGSRSYSLYLTHSVAGRAASQIRDQFVLIAPHIPNWLAIVIGVTFTVGLTLGSAELNFRFLETPLRAAGRRVAKSISRTHPNVSPDLVKL
jgi:peptidoglycan/LPS O-acetylase OafA/YrhL